MENRRKQFTWLLVLTLAGFCLSLPPSSTDRIKRFFAAFFLPLSAAQKAAQSTAAGTVDLSIPRTALLTELHDLRSTNLLLRTEIDRLRETTRENTRLQQQLQLRPPAPRKYRLARAIGRDTSSWWQTLQIDLGTNDGIKENLPVLTTEGLVGKIRLPTARTSQVALVGDNNCRVAILIVETRETGVLIGGTDSFMDHRTARIAYLPANCAARPGHTVITSGMGGVFPKGIPVGTIHEVQTVRGELQTTAKIKLNIDTAKLEEMWVMLP